MSELLTVRQVAAVLKVSEDTVTRIFSGKRGVVNLGTSEGRKKRGYRVLRIPVAIVEKYLLEVSGAHVKVEVPEEPTRHRKTDAWKALAILNLAKIAKHNECTDKTTFDLIAKNARWLAAKIPQQYWKEISDDIVRTAWERDDEVAQYQEDV